MSIQQRQQRSRQRRGTRSENAPSIAADAQIQIAVFALCSRQMRLLARRCDACVVLAACSQQESEWTEWLCRVQQSDSAVFNVLNFCEE
jgi:hypothetical protein